MDALNTIDLQGHIARLRERIELAKLGREPRIAVLASGGVDSSVVVHLLCEAGYKPTLYYIQIGMDRDGFEDCSWEDDVAIVSMLAKRYDLPLEIVSLHDEYWANVVQYTIDTVYKGLTPNPDMMCNKLIKFGIFEERWGYQYDFVATGHYATTLYEQGELYLATAQDPVKDQTDFLAQINFAQVRKLLFPTGHIPKLEVRAIAEQAMLPSAHRRDSQGICFLGKIDYNEFIRRALGVKPGRIIERETGKTLGAHQGYWFHTIGQRKGLGLSGGPWFVVKKDIKRNIILVSKGYDPIDQYGEHLEMRELNFISRSPWHYYGIGQESEPLRLAVKIRHTPEFAFGTLSYDRERDVYHFVCETKLQGIAPGQYCVLYSLDQRICFGSGEIVRGY